MYSIVKIEELIKSAEATLLRYEKELFKNPNSLFAETMIKTTENRLNELRNNLVFEKSARHKEIIDLRLKGKVAKVGKLPLELLGAFAKSFAEAIIEIGKQYQFGDNATPRNSIEIKNSIDLMFEKLVPGSTHIIVTGKTNPDLFGDSILESALANTFELLNTNDSAGLLETSTKIGKKGVKKINKMLKLSVGNELEFDLSWEAANLNEFTWTGDKHKILSLSNSISNIQSEKPKDQIIKGIVETLSLKGVIEVHDNDKKLHKISYPLNLLDQVKTLQIGESCNILCTQRSFFNSVTKEKKVKYELKEIRHS